MTATKSKRTLKVAQNVGNTYLVVTVQDGKRSDAYTAYTIPGGVRWSHRADASRSYTVTVSGGVVAGCGCPSRVWCRHQSASVALAERGQLDLSDCERDDLDGHLFTTETE
jgi:hypothetical protein